MQMIPHTRTTCRVCNKGIPLGSQWPNCCSNECYSSLFVPGESVPAEELAKGGTRADRRKPRVDLIPAEVLIELGKLYEIGARKYAPHNWQKGMAYSRMYASTMRHLLKFWAGESHDPEDGQHHLDAVIWGAVGLRYFELYPEAYKEFDDRFTQTIENKGEQNAESNK